MGWSLKRKTNGSLCRSGEGSLCVCGDGYKVKFPDPFNEGQVAKTYTLTQSGDVWVASDVVTIASMPPKDWVHISDPFLLFTKVLTLSIELAIDSQTGIRTVTVELIGQIDNCSPSITSSLSITAEEFADGTIFLLSEANLTTPIRRLYWEWPVEEAAIITVPIVIPDTPATTRVWRVHLFTYYSEAGNTEWWDTVSVTRSAPSVVWTRFISYWFGQGFWQTVTVSWDGSFTVNSWMSWAQLDQEGEPTRTITNGYSELISET